MLTDRRCFRARAAAALALSLALAPRPAAAGPWSFGLAGAVVSDFRYAGIDPYPERFEPSTVGLISAERPAGGVLSVRVETGYLRFERDVPLAGIPEDAADSQRLSAHFVPVSLGLRVRTPLLAESRGRAFVQVAPTFFWTGLNRHDVIRQGGFREPVTTTEKEYSIGRWLPGWSAAAGFEIPVVDRLGAECAVRYLASARIGRRSLDGLSAEDYRGLDQFALAFGLNWTP